LTCSPPVPAGSGTSDLGSISKVYDNLTKVANTVRSGSNSPSALPIHGNKEGSFLTMLSEGGLIFGIINVVGNFGTVFVDQAYWQSAIAGALHTRLHACCMPCSSC
jgi:Na+/proline symporter